MTEFDKEQREKMIMVILATAGYAFLLGGVVDIYFVDPATNDVFLILTLFGLPMASFGSGYFLRAYREKDLLQEGV